MFKVTFIQNDIFMQTWLSHDEPRLIYLICTGDDIFNESYYAIFFNLHIFIKIKWKKEPALMYK